MRFLFRWAFRLFLILVVVVVALVLLKDALCKSLAEHRLRAETGLDARIGKLEIGLLHPTLTIENLKLYNTAEFGGSPFVDLPELHLEASPRAFASQRLQFRLVRVSLNELNIVESKDGRTNIIGLLGQLETIVSTNSAKETVLGFPFDGIDTLNLTLGKIKYLSMKKPGKSTEVDLGLKNKIVTGVKSVEDLSNILITAMLQKGITLLGNPIGAPAESPKSSKPTAKPVKPQTR
ncbi:MAG: hypothetical protein FJ403_02715 [Verrucomicrobia bacterium]|nr:hypothetical protein [Verrucomicrobiota bacterium]